MRLMQFEMPKSYYISRLAEILSCIQIRNKKLVFEAILRENCIKFYFRPKMRSKAGH